MTKNYLFIYFCKMSFYLSPPEGIVSYEKLEMYGLKRLQFLIRLVQCRHDKEVEDVIQDTSIVDNSDCLIIGTAKDLISHYILRLLLGGCSETATFFCESESAFFKLQLKQMDKEELRIFFRGLDKNLKVFNVSSFYRMPLSNLLYLVEALKEIFPSWSTLVEEMCDDRSQTSVCLPFQMVLHLVASREVELQKGSAFVPLKLLKEVLQEQHQAVMSAFVQQARHAREAAIKDERIKRLAAVFKQVYRSEFKSSVDIQRNSTPLRLPELSSKEILFPPCMGNLMKALRHRHRLKHQDRIQLTLFLKELGLPLHDALLLWKHEYSKPDTSGDHKGWQGSEKKYIYNIQHLYGLQGGMINYRAHSCPSIQGRLLSCGDHGGCPFTVKDKTVLSRLAEDVGMKLSDLPLLERLSETRDFTSACQLYMLLMKLKVKREDNRSSNPNHTINDNEHETVTNVLHKSKNGIDASCKCKNGIDAPYKCKNGIDTPCKCKNGIDASCKCKNGIDAPYKCKNGIDTPCKCKNGIDAPYKCKNGMDAPCKSKNGMDAPCKCENGIDAPCKCKNGMNAPCKCKIGMDASCKCKNEIDAPCKCKNGIDAPCKCKNEIETVLNGLKIQSSENLNLYSFLGEYLEENSTNSYHLELNKIQSFDSCQESSKLKRCSCIFDESRKNKKICTSKNIYLKNVSGQSQSQFLSDFLDKELLGDTEVCHSKTYNSMKYDIETCHNIKMVPNDRHMHIPLARHRKPSECFFFYQNLNFSKCQSCETVKAGNVDVENV
ncbi:uncharacterized protein LOC106074699 isoform X1 [Biomphalaria glabrata]|uniref:Uncharacterized protein LOC106074699 isoform X1 n=1 Tax=Biomphalaria glabrata TaxID=6526 RepID=A0A9W3BJZ4_BIOGL|nr:uncharacterized protein LOC106074699 isoform X1 [Biomphalaria glabrata]XP_055899865.1 uncharacterized protein LOC106074699 isoform X1 [Biomphalaria glabrata]